MAKKNSFFPIHRVLLLIAGFTAIFYALHMYLIQKKNLLKYQEEIERLKQENAMLEKTLKQVETPFMTEKIAREQMGMMKNGEYKIQLKEKKDVSN